MKRFITIALFGIFFLVNSAYAGNLKLSESSISFGNIKEGPPVEKTITLTNQGTETLTIANTKTSCACTSVKLSKTALEPGENAELLIHYNTYKYPGKFDKTITIYTGPEGREETVIHIIGNVDPIPMGVIEMTPRRTVVGELIANKENTVQIILHNKGDATLTISRIYSTKLKKEYYNNENSNGIIIPAGEKKQIELKITPLKTEIEGILDMIQIYSDARNDDGRGYKGLLKGTAK